MLAVSATPLSSLVGIASHRHLLYETALAPRQCRDSDQRHPFTHPGDTYRQYCWRLSSMACNLFGARLVRRQRSMFSERLRDYGPI